MRRRLGIVAVGAYVISFVALMRDEVARKLWLGGR